ncbi:GrpB family protein [Mesobacillus foraminis]|nr:GrpB family protein [Mesobacillus foraminis]
MDNGNRCNGIDLFQYDNQWETEFLSLKRVLYKSLEEVILDIEHVGSTSVQGLGAKPILDIDIVIESESTLPDVINRLARLGYHHQEKWSYKGREAFGRKDHSVPWDRNRSRWMEHHVYVCHKGSEELAKHIAFRDYLRNHPQAVIEYEKLKTELALKAKDREEYTRGKTKFVHKILRLCGKYDC